jgi:hypothetical protein
MVKLRQLSKGEALWLYEDGNRRDSGDRNEKGEGRKNSDKKFCSQTCFIPASEPALRLNLTFAVIQTSSLVGYADITGFLLSPTKCLSCRQRRFICSRP